MAEVLYAVEGATDAPVAEKLMRELGRVPRQVAASGGSSSIDASLVRWARPSNQVPMLVLRDWDGADGVQCALELVRKALGGKPCPPTLVVRVPIRSIESWLMADHHEAQQFFGTRRIPLNPENLLRPKLSLVEACRASRIRRVRDGMTPRVGSAGAVGPAYAALLREFSEEHWNLRRAASNAPSLARALSRCEQLRNSGLW